MITEIRDKGGHLTVQELLDKYGKYLTSEQRKDVQDLLLHPNTIEKGIHLLKELNPKWKT